MYSVTCEIYINYKSLKYIFQQRDIIDFVSRVGADNFREGSQHSVKIEDSFQQVEELCRP